MPIFIPIGGDANAAVEFAGGLMNGVAVHRERIRQEQLAIDAQRRAQEFQTEMEDKRLLNSRLREQDTRDWQQLMHRQSVQDQRTLAQEADARIGARQVADDERAAAAKAQDAAAKAAEAEALMRAAGGGAPGADTEMGPPTTPEGMRPPAPPVTFRDPATARDYLHITDQRKRDASAGEDRDARLQLARERLDLDTQRLEIAAQKNGGRLTPEQRAQAADSLMRVYGFTPQQAQDRIALVENKLMATSQVQPEPNHVERDAARKNVDALRDIWEKAAGSQKNADRATAPQKKAAYEAAEAEFLKKFGPGATRPGASPAGAGSSIDDLLRQEMESVARLEEQLRQRRGSPRP